MSHNSESKPAEPCPNTLNNQSTSSTTSKGLALYSARAEPALEMDHTDTPSLPWKPKREPSSISMARKDSGYEAGCERRSTSTSSSSSRRPRHSTSSASTRPTNRRASRSTTLSSRHRTCLRPRLSSRYTTPQGPEAHSKPQYPHQFFQFPSLSPPATPIDVSEIEAQPPSSSTPPLPPATVHYFLLPETRRLEYAAIDAASRGVRGFITRLLPDCILPPEFRRTKFHDDDDDDGESDAGSVRRYRISFPEPEEKKGVAVESSGQWQDGNNNTTRGGAGSRPRPWRRMMSFGKA